MDIIYLFKVLVRRRWTILSCLAFGLAAGLLAYIISPTQYISTAQYYTGFAETRPVSLQSNDVYEASQTEFRVNNVIETFKSPLIVTMVSYELLLHDLESSSPFRILSGREKQKASFSKADNAKVRQILHDKLKSLKILSADEYWEKLVWISCDCMTTMKKVFKKNSWWTEFRKQAISTFHSVRKNLSSRPLL